MNFTKKKQIILFILSLFFNLMLYAEGFIAGTLVKTLDGFTPIEQLKAQDRVISYCFKNKRYKRATVLSRYKWRVDKYLQVIVNGQDLNVTHNHRFYLLLKNRWVKAEELKRGDILLSTSGIPIAVKEIKQINQPTQVYSLQIKHHHNFLVAHQGIVVHNIAIAIPLIIAFEGLNFTVLWGAMGKAVFDGICYSAVSYLGYHLTKSSNEYRRSCYERYKDDLLINQRNNNRFSQPNQSNSGNITSNNQPSPNNNQKPPQDDNRDTSTTKIRLPGEGGDWVKLKGDQGWKDADGNIWKKDKLHKDHWDISNKKSTKIREVDFFGREIWPNGPKNTNKRP
jgi:Fe-S cluster biosynthesis and repair protein YggX